MEGAIRCKNPGVNASTDPPGTPRSGTQSVERAIAVLECFAGSERSLGLTEIARAVELTPSTVHRLLRALIAAGYVEQDTTEHYRLGVGIAVLGQRALEQSGYSLARPVLERLSLTTGESASLGIRRGSEVVVIERTSGPAGLRFDHQTGAEIAMHASAMGKVLMAFSGESIEVEVDGLGAPTPFTDNTLASSADLATALHEIAQRGWATNIEERYVGVCGIAAPVRSLGGVAHAAIGLQGPSVRLTAERIDELAPLVVAAAVDVAALVIRI